MLIFDCPHCAAHNVVAGWYPDESKLHGTSITDVRCFKCQVIYKPKVEETDERQAKPS